MFKAIGRWGSQVKNTLSVHIFSNIFSSKSKKYGDLNNDEEEIFCDAQEEISDTESEHEDVPTTAAVETNGDISVKADINWNIETAVSSDNVQTESALITTPAEVSESKEEDKSEVSGNVEDLVTFDLSDETEKEKDDVKDTKEEEKTDSDNDSSCESGEDDDHHVHHSDKKKIVKNSKSSNGLVQSASATVIRKVHRRMNSYSQRQYAKFDDAQDDENDNVIQNDVTTSNDDVDSDASDKIDQLDSKTEKKTKRKKKIAKRTRKAVRGTWKWFKRSMVVYAQTFNFPSMLFAHVATATRK